MKYIKNIALIITLSVFNILFLNYSTFACSCIMPKTPTEAIKDTDWVFVWKVTKVETVEKNMEDFTYEQNIVNFEIEQKIKWEQDISKITTAKDSATCWFNFEEWKTYIVYTNYNEENKEYNVSLCSRTALLENASEDVTAFNINLDEKIEWQKDDKTLSSTWNIKVTENKLDEVKNIDKEIKNNLYIFIALIWVWMLILIFWYKIIKKD